MNRSLFRMLLSVAFCVCILMSATGETVVSGEENCTLTGNFGTKYRPDYRVMASYRTPDGYTVNRERSVNSSDYVSGMCYEADDPDAMVQMVYAACIANRQPDEMIGILKEYGSFIAYEDVAVNEIAGRKVSCLYGKAAVTDGNGQEIVGIGNAGLYIYTDAGEGSSCLLLLNTGNGVLGELPAAADLLPYAAVFLSGMTIVE